MTTEVSQLTTNDNQRPKIKPAHDVVIEQAFELETLRAEVKRLSQEMAEVIQERNQATVDFNQAISTLDESLDRFRSIDRLAAELKQCTQERDELRFDIVGLLDELTEEKQQRNESNALLLETARALGLDDSEVDELPQKAADLLAESWAVRQERSEEDKVSRSELMQIVVREAGLVRSIFGVYDKGKVDPESVTVQLNDFKELLEFAENPSSAATDFLKSLEEAQSRACEAEKKLAKAQAHIKSLDLRISLEVERGNELREAYREAEKHAHEAEARLNNFV